MSLNQSLNIGRLTDMVTVVNISNNAEIHSAFGAGVYGKLALVVEIFFG